MDCKYIKADTVLPYSSALRPPLLYQLMLLRGGVPCTLYQLMLLRGGVPFTLYQLMFLRGGVPFTLYQLMFQWVESLLYCIN